MITYDAYPELTFEFDVTCPASKGYFNHITGVGEPPSARELEVHALYFLGVRIEPTTVNHLVNVLIPQPDPSWATFETQSSLDDKHRRRAALRAALQKVFDEAEEDADE